MEKDIFECEEESCFYSYCIEMLMFSSKVYERINEFGSGDGKPVVNALVRTKNPSTIYGFEINKDAYKVANELIERYKLCDRYIVKNQSFFDMPVHIKATALVSNPPYLPAPDADLYLPSLYGGDDGTMIIKRLLSLGYDDLLLIVPSISDPESVIRYANDSGYKITNYVATPMVFGYYSSQPKVQKQIAWLRQNNKAFFSGNYYLLAGIRFEKKHIDGIDLSYQAVQSLQAFH